MKSALEGRQFERPSPVPDVGVAQVPSVGPGVLERRRLDEALDGSADLVLVNAPRGYGKTTSTARWASEALRHGKLVVWVTVSPGEGEPAADQLLDRVEEFVATATGSWSRRPTARGGSRWVPRLTVVVDGVRAARVDVVGVLREYGKRSGVRVVVLGSGWSDAHWPLGPLEVELGMHDLAWSSADVLEYASRRSMDLAEHVAHALATGLAGSPALVARAVEDLAHGSRSHPSTGEFVTATIRRHRALALSRYAPREVVDFLLNTCVEPSFDRAGLAGLTAVRRPERIAEHLVDAGVLHRYVAGSRTVYEYAPLLRHGLVDHARHLDPAGFAARIETRALQHVGRGRVRSAMTRVVEARSPGATDRLLERVWAGVLAETQDMTFDELWTLVLESRPEGTPTRLHLLHGALRTVPGRIETFDLARHGGPHDADFSRVGDRVPDMLVAPGEGAHSSALDSYLRVVHLRRAARPDEALRAAAQARDSAVTDGVGLCLVELQAGVAALYAGFLRRAATSAILAFQGALRAGAPALASAAAELAATVEACGSDTLAASRWLREREALPPAPDWWRACTGAIAPLVEALGALEDGRLEHATDALSRAESAAQGDLWFVYQHVTAAVAELSGHPESAADAIVVEAERRGVSLVTTGAAGRRPPLLLAQDVAWLQLAAGRGAAARHAAGLLPVSAPARQVLLAHLDLAAGHADKALQRVSQLTDQNRLSIGARLDGLVATADTLFARGQEGHARTELGRALVLAGRAGAGLSFRWASPAAQAVLRETARGDVGRRVGRVLDLVDGLRTGIDLVVLPERQQLVLRLLLDGLSVPQIAQELFVSPNTVKTQVRQIYRRLEVHSRSEAIARARQLGLVTTGEPGRHRPSSSAATRAVR
ncbi:LuxR C-terminal-related transcriptional regulator [Cellulosimicrobium cellulans]|uniref:LuxR C-terminal-related transcriptional regulator n=1 Tax=Cellulosimicrobium cellulans TaxID=1710 RepID=UPI00382D3D78